MLFVAQHVFPPRQERVCRHIDDDASTGRQDQLDHFIWTLTRGVPFGGHVAARRALAYPVPVRQTADERVLAGHSTFALQRAPPGGLRTGGKNLNHRTERRLGGTACIDPAVQK
jgi:hypothetical protein